MATGNRRNRPAPPDICYGMRRCKTLPDGAEKSAIDQASIPNQAFHQEIGTGK
jgi:hypothetical protein